MSSNSFTIHQLQPLNPNHENIHSTQNKLHENLLVLLKEQFESENRMEEDANLHLESFLDNMKNTGMISNTFWVLIVENDEREACGFICLCFLPKLNKKNGYLYVDELFVREKFRRCGIASILLDETKKIAKNLNMAGVRLLVRNENLKAQALYQKSGFSLSETLFGQFIPPKNNQ
ncbi:N-acetyltransferase [Naegleria gruberi]|uniref:N-acetyltransferase n=1 Tax=Naegleria gruberi TaxID=5762 RepID=D2VQ23_NAEGR|nr:N-acetyltransferase [Naegleria gruberi]EFC41104.1 N-acetyltransferase [Naegleria gruberi]|eukprot:XP_002673848.1 N-acetyltransferase [Naegleria gruberi strain NEG-M]